MTIDDGAIEQARVFASGGGAHFNLHPIEIRKDGTFSGKRTTDSSPTGTIVLKGKATRSRVTGTVRFTVPKTDEQDAYASPTYTFKATKAPN